MLHDKASSCHRRDEKLSYVKSSRGRGGVIEPFYSDVLHRNNDLCRMSFK